ncbi:C-C motif chemokine 4 [Pogona vitticeps]|uniref:C-C motif chemokine n=1 Tax=Pogona vitticeps TaxID=103695 RepID=A0A6J0UB35_9SAUR|nr:C-C motif chemokine 4-like [Pogona vitticeps]
MTRTAASATAPLLLLLLLLLGALWDSCPPAASAPVGSDPPTSCCFTYTAKKIPREYVVDYYETNSRCSQPAVVLITRKRKEICANPTERWVQEYVKDLELN